jgi:predicted O-linked N-acetylglucosamine transferase (SPINDLY family)
MHRERFQHFHEIGGMGPKRAADYIRALGLDILVTLDGYMDDHVLPILALRPAPLQLFWLGHADKLGLPFIDYVIADELVMPRHESGGPGEAVIRLPGTYHCADRHPIASECPPRSAWELPEHGVVYCVFNNPEKIDRTIMDCWLRILAAVDGSVLWFSPFRQDEALLLSTLRRYAAGRGIAPERLILTQRVPGKDLHLARLAHADLMLDTVTLNASTTALDALWAGVPLLAVQGDRFSNRISGSMLRAIGMQDLICGDLATYERRAIELGRDASARRALRERLSRERLAAPLFDVHRFARRLESAFEAVWARHLQGLAPADVDAPDPLADGGTPEHPLGHRSVPLS